MVGAAATAGSIVESRHGRPAAAAPVSRSLVPATSSGLQYLDPAYRRLYGPGTTVIDRLAYHYVMRRDGQDYAASQRFRAPKDGHIDAIRIYTPGGRDGEYAGGSGGSVVIGLYPDDDSDAHLPDLSEPALAEARFVPALRGGDFLWRGDQFPRIRFTAKQPMRAGRLYHLVYQQADARPETNYINLNSTATNSEAGRPMRWLDLDDWASLYGIRQGSGSFDWHSSTARPYGGLFYVPILQIDLRDGTRFGSAVMESGNIEARHWLVTDGHPIRERFRPSRPRSIGGLSVHTAAEVAGSLHWRLLADREELCAGDVTEAQANYRSIRSLTYQQGIFQWYDVPFDRPVSLLADRRYDLEFSVSDRSRWRFAAQRNGGWWGFQYPAAFCESQAEHRLNGYWTDAYLWNPRRITVDRSNWRVVLHEEPP